MKAICIIKCNFPTFSIDVDEWLEVYDEKNHPHREYYTFKKDGYELFCKKEHFITQEKWRELQLNKIICLQ